MVVGLVRRVSKVPWPWAKPRGPYSTMIPWVPWPVQLTVMEFWVMSVMVRSEETHFSMQRSSR